MDVMATADFEVTPPKVVLNTRMFDTSRWDHVKMRPGDIVVGTWAKSGTTLTQQLIHELVSGGDDLAMAGASPWVDCRFLMPLEPMEQMLEAQTGRRYMKTHSPFESVPFSGQVKYVYIGRDPRDVLWSAYNHATSFTDFAWQAVNAADGPWPKWSKPQMDVRAYYLHWLETDTMPGFHDMSFWDNVLSWWNQRGRSNVMLLHYANIIADRHATLRQLADFLEVDLDPARLPAMAERCSIDSMRAALVASNTPIESMFEHGAASFINKGTNGRWRDVLSPAEAALADEVAARRLPPDCAHWLVTGELPN
jgi:aryl sulfotransferase